jgi:hypothetical protein
VAPAARRRIHPPPRPTPADHLTGDPLTIHSTLFAIRGLYRDLAEWAHDDPIRWCIWVAPCPIPRAESRAAAKQRRRQKARMQARTRALTPLLPVFVAAGNARRDWATRLLTAAQAAAGGERFVVDGVTFARARPYARSCWRRDRAVVRSAISGTREGGEGSSGGVAEGDASRSIPTALLGRR